MINEEICQALLKAHIPAVREPLGVNMANNLRPDGLTLVPWKQGRQLAWDARIVDTMAHSYITGTARQAGHAANRADTEKRRKYQDLPREYLFEAVVFESLGSTSDRTGTFLQELTTKLRTATGDSRAGEYLLQRLALCLVRGNAAAVLGEVSGAGVPLRVDEE